MELTFRVRPARADVARETIESLENEIMRLVAERLGTGSKSWLEAGGYVKWSKGSASLIPFETITPIRDLADLGELQRIVKG
jgi:hypothetical protein